MKRFTSWITRLVNGWVVLGGLFITVLAVVLILSGLQPERYLKPIQPKELLVIPAPSATPKVVASATPLPTATPLPVIVETGEFSVGAYVQITGTGGDGLRIRAGAGLNYEPRFLGYEAEVFQIQDGPVETDNYVWWYLVAPYDNTRSGWAVQEYLVVVAVSQ